jgi:hypothetical protein
MKAVPRPLTRQRLRWMLAIRWLLFFLIVGLVLVLALTSWRRALRPVQAAMFLSSALSFQPSERQGARV